MFENILNVCVNMCPVDDTPWFS